MRQQCLIEPIQSSLGKEGQPAQAKEVETHVVSLHEHMQVIRQVLYEHLQAVSGSILGTGHLAVGKKSKSLGKQSMHVV